MLNLSIACFLHVFELQTAGPGDQYILAVQYAHVSKTDNIATECFKCPVFNNLLCKSQINPSFACFQRQQFLPHPISHLIHRFTEISDR